MMAALDAGAEDIVAEGDTWRLTTRPDRPARGAHRARGGRHRRRVRRHHDGAEHRRSPLDSAEAAKSVLRVIDALEDHDDVQDVYANFDIPDEIMATVEVCL